MAIKLGDALLKIGVDKKDFDRDMKGLSGAIQRHKKAIGVAMIGMGVAAVGAAAASIKAFADMGDEVQKMALRTGLSTEALSELRHAAEISGASLSTIEKGIKKMSKTIVDADEGMATYIRSFDRIGLSAEELMKLSPEDQFTRITEAIAALESPTLRAATAQDIFGRAGTELLPLMDAGAEGLAELRQEAHELGIVFDQEAADSAANFKDSLTRLEGAISGLKFALAEELTPALEDTIPLLIDFVKQSKPLIKFPIDVMKAWHRHFQDVMMTTRSLLSTADVWKFVLEEMEKSQKGLDNEYERSIDLLEEVLRSRGKLDDQAKYTINFMRERIGAQVLEKEAIEELTEATEELTEAQKEQLELQKEQLEAYEKTTKMINDIIKEMEYESSAAGRLGIRIDDVIKSLHLMGKSNEEIADTLVALGAEGDNVLKVLEAFGITAIQVAELLGIPIEKLEDLESAFDGVGEAAEKAGEKAESAVAALKAAIAGKTGIAKEEAILAYHEAAREEAERLAAAEGITVGEALKVTHGQATITPEGEVVSTLQHGGIAMRPMLAQIGEQAPRIPEAVIPLDRLERMMGGVTVTGNSFYVRNDTDITKIANAIVSKIRQKTGVKV